MIRGCGRRFVHNGPSQNYFRVRDKQSYNAVPEVAMTVEDKEIDAKVVDPIAQGLAVENGACIGRSGSEKQVYLTEDR